MPEYSERFNECEAVPVKVNRVFDSCSDKDCVEGVAVELDTPLPQNASIVKTKCISVTDACISTEPIPFNKGFYSVDITFTFNVQMLAYENACGVPVPLTGTASVNKNCILFGSQTNSRTFTSTGETVGSNGKCCDTLNPPTALVQAVSPIVLESKITNGCSGCECLAEGSTPGRSVLLTVGLFYVVELIRPVTIMVPAYNYTIPQKECCTNTDTPCEVFDKIRFPTEEFSPVKLDNSYNCGCQADRRLTSDDCDCDI